MNYIICISLFVGLFSVSGPLFAKAEVKQVAPSSQLLQPVDSMGIINWIKIQTAKELTERYKQLQHDTTFHQEEFVNLAPSSLFLIFHTHKLIPKEEARALGINCVETFAKNINANRAIRPYLRQYPFSVFRVGCGIYTLYDAELEMKQSKKTNYPSILFLHLNDLTYYFLPPESDP
ncbi:MAG: hypothetical protein JWO53_856, partial [Chlamydiia bacterium]|nr:hypothetical protein [Chlamydiia bacterium]